LLCSISGAWLKTMRPWLPLGPAVQCLLSSLFFLALRCALSLNCVEFHICLLFSPCCGRRRSLWLVRCAGVWRFLFAFLGCAKAYLKQFTAPEISIGPEDPLNSFSMGTIFGVCGLLALPQSPDPGGWPCRVSVPTSACRGAGFLLLRAICYGNSAVVTPGVVRGGLALGKFSGGN
jgi:hypothetical protein